MKRSILGLLLVASSILLTPNSLRAEDEVDSLDLLVGALSQTDDPELQNALLQGMVAGLDGRRDLPAPKGWSKLAARLAKSEDAGVREMASQLSRTFGDEAATKQALLLVQDKSADIAARRRALRSLLLQKNTEVSALLVSLLNEPEFRLDAIRGFAAIENSKASKILLKYYVDWPSEHRQAIVETLATRKSYAEALLDTIKTVGIPKEDIPAHVARSLGFLLGDSFVEVFGDVRELSQDRTAQIAKYKKLLTAEALETADPGKGRAIFKKTCAACHTLYGTGGKIGPDLTGSNRANLDYILLNSVDPSYDVPVGYKMIVIQTVDGRVLNGVIAEEDGQRVILKTVEQPRVVVLKSDIEDRLISPKSMMPDGQLEQMKPQEVKDLIKYLQTIEQVEITP
jgi:putative heme-binding domain-containing protein